MFPIFFVEGISFTISNGWYMLTKTLFYFQYEIGGLVAALAPDDNCWYRAKVVLVDLDESCTDENIISVVLVDFGDVVSVKQRYVANLRPDFLTMRFQAIECTLADVNPIG